MSRTATKDKQARSTSPNASEQRRLCLTFPPALIKEPLIWKLAQRFPVVTNIRQASVTDVIGIVTLELDGRRSDIKAAIKWLEKQGVSVQPVEINVIES
jgi:ABC-type methionine transport system ATPase subunit